MIQVNHLSKVYYNQKGIFDLNFTVEKGEVFGYLGPNGAGKTTTIRNLLGFVNPTNGNCSINGKDCRTEAADIQKMLGYLPGEIAFFDEMTGIQFLNFISELRGYEDKNKRLALMERFELEADRKIKKMSKGMKQKVAIIAAFMHNPEVLILDEPTSGLDPLMQSRFIDLINEEKKQGKTILMSSHNFDEVEKTCSRVGIINEGKLIAVENVVDLKANQNKVYVITFLSKVDTVNVLNSHLDTKQIDDFSLQITIHNNYNEMLHVLSQANVVGIDVLTQNLEQIFMHYYGKETK